MKSNTLPLSSHIQTLCKDKAAQAEIQSGPASREEHPGHVNGGPVDAAYSRDDPSISLQGAALGRCSAAICCSARHRGRRRLRTAAPARCSPGNRAGDGADTKNANRLFPTTHFNLFMCGVLLSPARAEHLQQFTLPSRPPSCV